MTTITLTNSFINSLESANFFGGNEGESAEQIQAVKLAWLKHLFYALGSEIDADAFDQDAQTALHLAISEVHNATIPIATATTHNRFPHCPTPHSLAGASPSAIEEFYLRVFRDILASLPPDELVDDLWSGWTGDTLQPLPDDAPEALKRILPDGWRPCFDINFLLHDGDWGWDDTHDVIGGWQVLVVAESVEWVEDDLAWCLMASHRELFQAKARKTSDGGWQVEALPHPCRPQGVGH